MTWPSISRGATDEADYKASSGGTPLSGKAKLDPWLIGAGVTYRF